jgi:hypothetical protein
VKMTDEELDELKKSQSDLLDRLGNLLYQNEILSASFQKAVFSYVYAVVERSYKLGQELERRRSGS